MGSERPDLPSPGEAGKPPAKHDWLHTMARATETVAPLVARQAPKADDIPEDRRGRWATLLAIIGILMATLQFLVQFFDLMTRPLAPLLGVLPYLVVVLFVAAAGFALYLALRAHTRRQRIGTLAVASVVIVVGVSWGSWLAYDTFRPPAGFRILVSEFDSQNASQQIDFGRRIAESLKSQLGNIGVPIEIKRTTTVFADAGTARTAGQQQQAGLVIWGWYDDKGVSPHIEVLQLPATRAPATEIPLFYAKANAADTVTGGAPMAMTLQNIALVVEPPAVLPDLNFFLAFGPDQVAFVTSSILAFSYLANGDEEQGLALLDQALAAVDSDPQRVQGQDVVHYQRALLNYRKGDLALARADLDAALMSNPDNAAAHTLLAAILAEGCTPVRQPGKALVEAQQAASLQPSDAASQRLVAQLALRMQDLDLALQAAQKAQRLAPDDPQTLRVLGAVYAARQQPREAQAARQRALTLLQGAGTDLAQVTSDDLLALGDAYVAVGEYARALASYQLVLVRTPIELRAWSGIGDAYTWLGQFDEVVHAYLQWAALAPNDAAPQMLLGIAYDASGQPDQALAAYQRAAQLAQCDPAPYALLGGASFAAGDLEAAKASYDAALASEPDNPDFLYVAGALRYQLGEYDEARRQLEAAVARQPSLLAAYYTLGVIHELQGNASAAEAAFEQIVAHAGEPPQSSRTLAFAYEKLGRVQDAIALYLTLLDQHESADLHMVLGMLYATSGANDLAMTEFRHALALDPTQSVAWDGLAGALYAQGDLAGAAEAYEQSLQRTDSATTHQLLSLIVGQLGQPAKAYDQLRAAADLDPQNTTYPAQLGQLALKLGKVDEAAIYLERARLLQPNDPMLAVIAAQVAYKRCDMPAVVSALARAVELAPDNMFYVGALADAYAAQGRTDAAAPLLAQLRAAPDTDFAAHWLAGNLMMVDGRADEAEAEYRHALAYPELPPQAAAIIRDALGQRFVATGNWTEARVAFSETVQIVPDFAPAWTGMGDVALLQGTPALALRHYTAALDALETYSTTYDRDAAAILAPVLHVGQALAYRGVGDEKAATAELAVASEMAQALRDGTPGWPAAHFVFGTVLAVDGDAANATKEFDAAIACDAKYAAARDRLLARLAQLRK